MKKIINFFGSENRFGLFLILFISAWALIGNTIIYFLPLSSLKKHHGPVELINLKSYNCYSGKFNMGRCERTDIRLENYTSEFHIKTRVYQGGLIGGVSPGDTTTIYTRHWYQYPLTFGSINAIYQLEKGNEILYEFNWIKERNYSIMIVSSIILIIFLAFLYVEIQTVALIKRKKLH